MRRSARLVVAMALAASLMVVGAPPVDAGDPPIIVQLDIFVPSETVSFDGYHPFLGNERDFDEAGGSVARVQLVFNIDGELIDSQLLNTNWVGVTGPTDHVPLRPSWWHQTTDDSRFTPEVEADVIQTSSSGSVAGTNTFQVSLSIGNAFDFDMPRIDSELILSIGPDPEAIDLDAEDVVVQARLTHDSWPNYQLKVDGSEFYRYDVEDESASSNGDAETLLNSLRSSGTIEVHHSGGPGPNNPKDVRDGRDGGKGNGGGGFYGAGTGSGFGAGGGGGDQVPFNCDGVTIWIDNTTEAHVEAAEDCKPEPVT